MKATDGVSGAGRSILEMLWERLDEFYAELQDGAQATAPDRESLSRLQGRCFGLATAIATMINPYEPNVPEVNKQARERYTAKQAAA